MRQSDTIEFLHILGAKNIEIADGWVRCSCLRASFTHENGTDSKPSFGIKINDLGFSTFHCFTCGSGTLLDLVHQITFAVKYDKNLHNFVSKKEIFTEKNISEVSYQDNYKSLEEESDDVALPVPFCILDEYPLLEETEAQFETKRIVEWLEGRGIPRGLAYEQGLRAAPEFRSVVFPLKETDGIIYKLHARNRIKKAFFHLTPQNTGNPELVWGSKSVWYGLEAYDPDKPVILVESETDRLRLLALGFENILASAGSVGPAKLRRITSNIVYLGYDSDAAGVQYCMNTLKNVNSSSFLRLHWSKVGAKDAGDLVGKEQALEVFNNASSVVFERGKIIIRSPKKQKHYIDNY